MATNTKDFLGRYGAQFQGKVKGTQLESTVSTGTAPLIVASQTLVSNLNAEFLNGSPSSAFAANPMTTVGDMIIGGASGAQTRLAVGTDNYVLAVVSGSPAWVANTGTGSVVRATSPTLTTPTLGVATATTINKLTITAPATGSTLTIADGKTLTVSNTLTFTGTDSSSVAFGTGGNVAYTGGTLAQFAATTSSALAGVISDETGSGSLVFATSPTLVTPNLGTPSALTLTNATGLPISGITGLGSGVGTLLATPSSANLAAAITDETGSGALVFGTSPAFTTSVTTGSTTFAVFNTTATTVNAFGAATTLNMGGSSGNTTIGNNLIVTGNLTVNGTTVTTNSTTVTIDDPIFTIGGDTAPGSDDNKDRGIEFRWHNGTSAKVGFFGFDDSTGYFTFIPDATNTSEVFSGSQGDIQAANFRGALIGNADTATKATNLTGGNGTTLLGTIHYQSGTDISSTLAPNTTTTKKFLRMTGTGSNGAAPAWDTLVDGDIPSALTGKTYNGLTVSGTTGTFTLTNGKTFAVQNSVTLAGTDGTTITLPSTTGTVALNNQTMFIGTTSVAINRSSSSLALTGITSIDGSAASLAATNAVVSSAGVTITANSTPTTIDSFAVTTYTSAHYVVQMKQGTKMTTTNFLVIWDGTDVNITEYGYLDATAGAANATITAAHSAGTLTVSATSSDATTTNVVIKALAQYVKA